MIKKLIYISIISLTGYLLYFAFDSEMIKNICTGNKCVTAKGNWKKVNLTSGPNTLSIYKKNVFGKPENNVDIYYIDEESPLSEILNAAFIPMENTPLGVIGSIDNKNSIIREKNYVGIFEGKLYLPEKRVFITCQEMSCISDILDIKEK